MTGSQHNFTAQVKITAQVKVITQVTFTHIRVTEQIKAKAQDVKVSTRPVYSTSST